MIQSKKSTATEPKTIEQLKDDEIAPKGRTKHIVETDWPTKEVSEKPKRRKIKKIDNSRLP